MSVKGPVVGPDGLVTYRHEKNLRSIDGLVALDDDA